MRKGKIIRTRDTELFIKMPSENSRSGSKTRRVRSTTAWAEVKIVWEFSQKFVNENGGTLNLTLTG